MSDKAIEKPISRIGDDELHEIKSFQDAFDLLGADFAPEDYSEAYGTGFIVLSDKSRLEGVSFVIVEWRFSDGKYGEESEFASLVVVTEPGEKFIVNDGSTGIKDQLKKVTQMRVERGASPEQAHRGLLVRGGLNKSEYEYESTNAKTGKTEMLPATTYYLAN